MNGAPPRPQKRAPGRPGACYAGLMRDLFDSRTFGPQPGDQKLSELRRFWRWVRGHQGSAQVVICIAIAYLAFAVGLLFGAGVRGWWS
jgi:hypothetical protein